MKVDFSAMRAKMVDGQIRTSDVTNPDLIVAMGAVPREEFVPATRRELAYIDQDIEIAPACGGHPPRYLMDPSPFARLVQLAALTRSDKVLDIGCGTGYSAAVLSHLASSVVALECDPALAASARRTLADARCQNVTVAEGPLARGYPASAPYDVIVLDGAVERIPEDIFEQLAEGGRLVAVVGSGNAGMARKYVKEDGLVAGRAMFNASVGILPGFGVEIGFRF